MFGPSVTQGQSSPPQLGDALSSAPLGLVGAVGPRSKQHSVQGITLRRLQTELTADRLREREGSPCYLHTYALALKEVDNS